MDVFRGGFGNVGFWPSMKTCSDTKYDISCKEGIAHIQGNEQALWRMDRKKGGVTGNGTRRAGTIAKLVKLKRFLHTYFTTQELS